jgi:hypothetical protein
VQIPGYISGVSQLQSVFDQVLSAVPEEREFSIGVNSLVARPGTRLTITRGEPSRIGRLRMEGNQVEVAEAMDLLQQESFTRIEWTDARSRSLDKELETIRQHFRYSRIPITLNGKRIEVPFGRPRGPGMFKHLGAAKQVLLKPSWFQPATYFWADHHALEFRLFHPQSDRNELGLPSPSLASSRLWVGGSQPGSGCFLALAFCCDGQRSGRIDWVYRGQVVDSQPEDFSIPAIHAVIACQGLTLDVTGERPVDNQARAARRQLVRDWIDCVHDYLQQRYSKEGVGAVQSALFDGKVLSQEVELPRTPRVAELLQRLGGQPTAGS